MDKSHYNFPFQQAIHLITEERKKQDNIYGTAHDDSLSNHDWLYILNNELTEAAGYCVQEDTYRQFKATVKVAAVALAFLESNIRKTSSVANRMLGELDQVILDKSLCPKCKAVINGTVCDVCGFDKGLAEAVFLIDHEID